MIPTPIQRFKARARVCPPTGGPHSGTGTPVTAAAFALTPSVSSPSPARLQMLVGSAAPSVRATVRGQYAILRARRFLTSSHFGEEASHRVGVAVQQLMNQVEERDRRIRELLG
jgi:hypothetical protein